MTDVLYQSNINHLKHSGDSSLTNTGIMRYDRVSHLTPTIGYRSFNTDYFRLFADCLSGMGKRWWFARMRSNRYTFKILGRVAELEG